jgi:hypothetical protein
MCQGKDEVGNIVLVCRYEMKSSWLVYQVAGHLVLDLNQEGISVSAAECDDRRFIFQINDLQHKK